MDRQRSRPLPIDTGAVAPSNRGLQEKRAHLEAILKERRGVLVAYSGGVDSTLVAAAAVRAVGAHAENRPGQGAMGVLADSTTLARRELHLARATADQIGLPLHEVRYSELDNPQWKQNTPDRCYHCKSDLSEQVLRLAPQWGYQADQVAYGTTTSDLGDHRPGLQAIGESDGWQPLVEAGLSKPEVRALAKDWGLPVWEKPATPCLASRVQYGETITEQTLERIEQAENSLHELGFRVLRVRHHDRLARIEVPPQELQEVLNQRKEIIAALKQAGYTYVTLDLVGHRSGAMNEVLY